MKKLLILTLFFLAVTIGLQISIIDTPNTNHSMSLSIFGWHPFGSTTTATKKTASKPTITGGYIPSNHTLGTQATPITGAANSQYLPYLQTTSGATPSYYGYGAGAGGSTSSGYSTGVAQPDTTDLQNSVRGRISAIQNAYGALQGSINPVIQDKVNQLLQSYNTQTKGLNDQFGQTTAQTQNIYGARGLGDSSFQGNALDQAGNTYNTNLAALNQDKQNNLAGVGQYAQNLVSGAQANSAQYGQYLPHLGQYSASDLQSLDSQLAGALPGVQQQVAGMGTNQQFLNTLGQYAPQINQGASQLQDQLKTLASSSAPYFAKNQIAQGLIKSSQLQDPNAQSYYSDYFSKLLNPQGA